MAANRMEYVVGFGVKVNCRKAAREDALGYPDEPCDDTQMMRLILKTTLVCHPERSRRILKVPGLALNNRGAKCRYEFVRILDMSCELDMLPCGNEDTTPPSRRCRATSPTLQGRLLIVTIHTEFIDFILIKSL